MPRPRVGLVIVDKSGRWLMRDGSPRTHPMRTRDVHFARTWEAPEALQAWIDDIPDAVPTDGGKSADGRAWMADCELEWVELEVVSRGKGKLTKRIKEGELAS